MAETKSRNDNSGLIDLDALMKEAESAPALPAAAPSSPAVDDLPPARVASAPTEKRPEHIPPRAATGMTPPPAPRAEDSLEAITTSLPVSPPVSEAPSPAPNDRPTRPEGLRPSRPTPDVVVPAYPDVAAAKGSRYTRIAVAALALVSVGVIASRLGPGTTSPAAAETVAVNAPPPAARDVPRAEAAPAAATAAVSDDAHVGEAAVSAATLAAVPTSTSATAPSRVAVAKVSSKSGSAPAAEPEPEPEITTKTIESTPTSAGDLGDAMRGAVGARDAKPAPVETTGEATSSARQLRPSPGAVVGAINAVLPEARACLGPDDPIRSGSITFKSDGSVASVSLQGAKSVDPCIREALTRARVAPFVDDSFTTRVTVRP